MDPFTAFLLQQATNRAGRIVLELGAPNHGNLFPLSGMHQPDHGRCVCGGGQCEGGCRCGALQDPEPDYDCYTTKFPWEC